MLDPSATLVLGAAGGIGEATCRRLVAAGGRVLLAGRTEQPLAALAGELGQPHVVLDATDWEAVAGAVDTAIGEFGTLTGAVNFAGSILLKPAHLTSREDLDSVYQANVVTAFGLIRAAAPKLRKQGGGSIVLMASGGAAIGLTNHEAIAMAKAGISAMARAAAATYASAGVRINTVSPGLVKTGLTTRVWEHERSAEVSRSMHPLGRLGEPDDIASLVAWLLDPGNTWITGQDIAVDGGLSQVKAAVR